MIRMPNPPPRQPHGGRPSTLTAGLAAFALANVLLVSGLLVALPNTGLAETSLEHAQRFLRFDASHDSWEPIREAYQHLRDDAPGKVYDAVFFDRDIKFQYPLSTLMPAEVLDRVTSGDSIPFTPFNAASWAAIWITALFVAMIFLRSLEKYAPAYLPARRMERLFVAAVVFSMTITFYPLTKAFTLGQIQAWISCLFAALVWLWLVNRPVAAGVVGGLICVIKPQLGLLLVWSLIRRQWGFAWAFSITAGVVAVATLALYGVSQNLNYFDVLSFISRRGEGYYPNQSINGLLNRLLENGQNREFAADAFPPFDPIVYTGTVLTSLVIVGLALLWRWRDRQAAGTLDLLIAGLSFTIASPVAWEHHYGVLMPMYAVLLPALLRWPVFGRWTLLLLGASYVLTSQFFHTAQELADRWYLTPGQSYLLGGASFVLVMLYFVRQREAEDPAFVAEAAGPQPSNSVAPSVAASTIS